MPKRKRIVRHKSDEVQGAGSWVDVRFLSVEEARESRRASLAIYDKYDVPHDLPAGKFDEYPEFQDEFAAFSQANMSKIFIAWNWVDDDDLPLPQPGEDGSMDRLTTNEVNFLTNLMRAEVEKANEKKG